MWTPEKYNNKTTLWRIVLLWLAIDCISAQMPRKCSVPACRSNYDKATSGVTTFCFPKEPDLCQKWLRNINRDHFTPGPSACVCIKHFDEQYIIREDRVKRSDAEIQNYSFDGLDDSFTKERRELDRDTTSQDSGISQMSVLDGRMHVLEEKYESSPDEEHSPTTRKDYNGSLHQEKTPQNGYGHSRLTDSIIWSESKLAEGDYSSIVMQDMEEILFLISDIAKRSDERINALEQLSAQAKLGSPETWNSYFRLVLRTLVDVMEDADASIRAKTFNVLCEVLRYHPTHFQGFSELTIVKILHAHKDPDKDVVRSVEMCAGVLASVFSVEQSVRVINPLILTEDLPVNLAAIKMLTKIAEQRSREEILPIVSVVMSGLLKAFNSPESSVRKAAVFCMVALHMCTGEAVEPYLNELNGSKVSNSEGISYIPSSHYHSLYGQFSFYVNEPFYLR